MEMTDFKDKLSFYILQIKRILQKECSAELIVEISGEEFQESICIFRCLTIALQSFFSYNQFISYGFEGYGFKLSLLFFFYEDFLARNRELLRFNSRLLLFFDHRWIFQSTRVMLRTSLAHSKLGLTFLIQNFCNQPHLLPG